MSKRKVNKLRTKDFFEWINYQLSSTEEDADLHMLECSLIRCMSEYRKLKISQIHFSENFHERFINALEKEKTILVPVSKDSTPFWQMKAFRYSIALLFIAGIIGSLSFFGIKNKTEFVSQTAASLKLDPDILQELKQEFQLIKHIRSSNDIESLRLLEEYNLSNGITDRATRIHYTIEILSK